MEPLAKPLRKQLEDVVVAARDKAEAHAALMHLGVCETEVPGHLTDGERALRRRPRAHGRQVGDHRRPDGDQAIDHLVQETAYEHWHRMLFARFLLAGDVSKKGAGVLRAKPNIHWKKDRGKDVENAPWYHLFQGNRINDHHLTLAEKRAARKRS